MPMTLPVSFDHCVVHVSDWERSNAFYHDVLGAELVRRPQGWAYRFGAAQLNLHGPGFHPAEVARLPVAPGNSDLCFRWDGPIADAIVHLEWRARETEPRPSHVRFDIRREHVMRGCTLPSHVRAARPNPI